MEENVKLPDDLTIFDGQSTMPHCPKDLLNVVPKDQDYFKPTNEDLDVPYQKQPHISEKYYVIKDSRY